MPIDVVLATGAPTAGVSAVINAGTATVVKFATGGAIADP